MKTKVRTFFDETTGDLVRTVIPDEYDEELTPHTAQLGEVMVDIPLSIYEALSIANVPKKGLIEEWYKNNRQR